MFAIPAFCYFVSNNCMFYIIRELGPTTYQITNNLKVLSTALLMRVFLARKLSWVRWKALVLLVVGSVVAELNGDGGHIRGSALDYFFVLFSCFASSTGGVFTEKLLKGKSDARECDSIHWQNIQLYFFGVLFGWLAFVVKNTDHSTNGIFTGFNSAAYAMIVSQTMLGLSVSFVLKYIDNIAKCFVAAVSMLCVALLHTSMHGEMIPVRLIVSIVLIFFALERYNNNT
jgi:UDP-galactose transporter